MLARAKKLREKTAVLLIMKKQCCENCMLKVLVCENDSRCCSSIKPKKNKSLLVHLLLIMCTGCCINVKAERNDALFPLFLVTHSMQQILNYTKNLKFEINYTKNLKFKINCTKNFFTGASIPHQG